MNYIIRKFLRIKRLAFAFLLAKTKQKPQRRNSGRSMLNQPKEVLRICVPFQGSQDSIKEEPEKNVYDMFLSNFLSDCNVK